MYYLQSRYYDAEVGRFVNADEPLILLSEPNSLINYNLFAYCLNSPVTNIDPFGFATISLKKDLFMLDGLYYGGNQSWWGNETFKYLYLFNRLKKNVGCAPVAAANIIAYLALQNSKLKKLYSYTYTKVAFYDFMGIIWKYVTPGAAGYWWIDDFARDVEKYAKSKGITLKGYFSNKKPNLENAIQYVKNGLKRDCPVVLNVFGNSKLKIGTTTLGRLSGHFMVITSIKDDRDGKGKGSVTVTVSSWNKKYTIDFREAVNSTIWGIMYFTW